MKTGTAVVIGGSIAGSCAARVLADHFARVVVLDRDAFPQGALGRPGVPQSRHVHTLLARGCAELERLFPGFEATMLAQGALRIDFGTEFATLRRDGWAPRLPGGVPTLFASRNLLESIVRDALRRVPNVDLRERTTATGLRASDGAERRVRAVCTSGPDGENELEADLVVGAGGRSSRAPEWLRHLGLEPPAETVIDSHAGYSTRWFTAPARLPSEWWWKAIWLDIDLDRPESSMAGVLFPVEGRQWIVTLAGVAGHYLPSDEEGFMRALHALRSPIIAEAVARATPASRVYSYRAMANRHRHYERWPARLGGFVAVGDAACTFNPVYGQGMTTGAVSARILGDCLARDDAREVGFPRRFFRAQSRLQRDAWAMATGADFRLGTTEGKRPFGFAWSSRYMDELFRATYDDVALRTLVSEVMNMLRPPAALFTPRVAAKVALRALRRGFKPPAPASDVPAFPPQDGATVRAA
ncbi:MAG: FAD-dependent monooxygenase [Thermodesulfobacteriota bacterium]